MKIGEAVEILRRGGHVTRKGWNGTGMHLYLVDGDGRILPYVMMFTAQGQLVPWLCSQTDLLATDWEEMS
jgi:hypothetical protein